MSIFNVNLKELFYIILALPISLAIFFINHNKINYEIEAKQAYAVTHNFCENFSYLEVPIIKKGDIELIIKKHDRGQSRLESAPKNKINISLNPDLGVYKIKIKGVIGQEDDIIYEANRIFEGITQIENIKFNDLYKNTRLHCKSGMYNVFKFVPMKKNNGEFKLAYKKFLLIFLSILPLLIFYLIIISFKYLNIFNYENQRIN